MHYDLTAGILIFDVTFRALDHKCLLLGVFFTDHKSSILGAENGREKCYFIHTWKKQDILPLFLHASKLEYGTTA